jgi:hypothetical protein
MSSIYQKKPTSVLVFLGATSEAWLQKSYAMVDFYEIDRRGYIL